MASPLPHSSCRWSAGRGFLLLALLSALGCRRNPNEPEPLFTKTRPALIAWVAPQRPVAAWPAVCAAARARAAELGNLRLEFLPAGPEDSHEGRLRDVAAAARLHPDAICMWISDAKTEFDAVNAAQSAAGVVVTMGERVEQARVFGHVEDGTLAAADLLGQALSNASDDVLTYGLVHEQGGGTEAERCYERFMLSAPRRGGAALLKEVEADDAGAGAAIMEIKREFRHVRLIITLSPRPWLANPPQLTLGRDGETQFACIGAAPALWPTVQFNQAWALVGVLDGQIGTAAVELVISGITHSHGPGEIRNVTPEVVTRGNLRDFATRYAQAAHIELSALWPDADAPN